LVKKVLISKRLCAKVPLQNRRRNEEQPAA
jgi:hypothetical protein